jgi:biopolymer transport protein ExbB
MPPIRRALRFRLAALLTCAAVWIGSPAVAQETAPGANAPKPSVVRHKISFDKPLELVQLAGPIFWPLLLCSLATITFGFERLIALRYRRVLAPTFARKFKRKWDAAEFDRAAAMEFCRANGSPLAMLYLAAVRLWGRPTAEIQKAVGEAGSIQIIHLRRNLRVLQMIANVATLLGLLGTVLGMIHSFNNVTELRGLQRGEELSRGIAEALVATAMGLAVAIPSLFLYTFFAGRVERLVVEMDERASEVVDLVSAESLAAVATPAAPPNLTIRR